MIRVAAMLVFGAFALSMIGCLVAEETAVVTYDKASDQFSVLMIYQHIRGDAGEVNDVLALYRNRNNLIILPTIRVLSETQTLRLSDNLAAVVDMGNPTTHNLQAYHPPFGLGAIQIKPGELFLNDGNDLCYAHQLIIPGSVADDAVRWLNDYLRRPEFGDANDNDFKSVYQAMDAELTLRANGQTQMSWKDFTAQCIAETINSLEGKKEAASSEAQATAQLGFPFRPLDNASLQSLRHAAEQGRIVFSRQGAQLSIRLPLTPADIAGGVAFFTDYRQALRDKLPQLVAAKSDNAQGAQLIVEVLNSMNVAAFDQSNVQVSIDVSEFFKTVHQPPQLFSELKAEDQDKATRFALSAQHEIGVNKSLTVDQVKQDFLAEKFAIHPQNPPVAPGDGLGEIEPPEK